MTVYVLRDGRLVEKGTLNVLSVPVLEFPMPMLSRLLEPFESPVTGKEISNWRDRDRDMRAVDAFDVRDVPKDHTWRRGREAQLKEAKDVGPEPIWR